MKSNPITDGSRTADAGNARLCLYTAAVLFIAGIVGLIANFIVPGSTNLDALLAVSAFYLALAGIDTRISARIREKEGLDTLDANKHAASPSYRRAA